MQLTITLKRRWITSVLAEAKKTPPPMPWQRTGSRKPVSSAARAGRPRLVEARA